MLLLLAALYKLVPCCPVSSFSGPLGTVQCCKHGRVYRRMSWGWYQLSTERYLRNQVGGVDAEYRSLVKQASKR